jgi:hypothetical protein
MDETGSESSPMADLAISGLKLWIMLLARQRVPTRNITYNLYCPPNNI